MNSNNNHHRTSSSRNGKVQYPVAHSTPSKSPSKTIRFDDSVKNDNSINLDMTDGAITLPSTRFVFRRDLPSQSSSPNRTVATDGLSDMERDTIIKQRTELQLLIGELKDRDRELNEMVQTHQQQMKAWEEDRQRSMNVEQKCAKLERDLNKRNHQIRELLKKLKSVEAEALHSSNSLNDAQCQLNTAVSEHHQTFQQLRDLEAHNENLQLSLKQVSQLLGETEGKVSQLQNQLTSKEKEALLTSKEVTDMASRLQSLEHSYKQLEKITLDVKTSANDWKNKYTQLKLTHDSLKGELDISNATIDEKEDEMERLRGDIKSKQNELNYALERETRKDQLLGLQKSKQERTDRELSTLRQMYDLQQHKLSAVRKELVEIKEKDIKLRTSELAEHSELLNTSCHSSPNRTRRSTSPLKYSISPQRSPTKYSNHHQSSEYKSEQSSTERLQKLLSDSKRLVETIASNESHSPSQILSQMSLSGSP